MPYDSDLVDTPGTAPLPAAAHRLAAQLLRRLAVLWRQPAVARVRVVVHPGLRRTLGRYSLRTRRIELSPAVLSPKSPDRRPDPRSRARGPRHRDRDQASPPPRPGMATAHGPGRPARCPSHPLVPPREARSSHSPKPQQPQPKPPTTYDHWCPVCQATRPAKKPVRAWRCAACVAAGLQGRLEITPRAPRTPEPRAQAPTATAQP